MRELLISGVTIIYISHKLEDLQIGIVTVLRDGNNVVKDINLSDHPLVVGEAHDEILSSTRQIGEIDACGE